MASFLCAAASWCVRRLTVRHAPTVVGILAALGREDPFEAGLDQSGRAGKASQRLASQLSSEGSSFQGAALFEPDGAHSVMASVFMRIVISA